MEDIADFISLADQDTLNNIQRLIDKRKCQLILISLFRSLELNSNSLLNYCKLSIKHKFDKEKQYEKLKILFIFKKTPSGMITRDGKLRIKIKTSKFMCEEPEEHISLSFKLDDSFIRVFNCSHYLLADEPAFVERNKRELSNFFYYTHFPSIIICPLLEKILENYRIDFHINSKLHLLIRSSAEKAARARINGLLADDDDEEDFNEYNEYFESSGKEQDDYEFDDFIVPDSEEDSEIDIKTNRKRKRVE